MDLGRIITRSFEIAWRHKVLWLLGFVFALFGGTGGSPGPFNYSFNNSDFRNGVPPWLANWQQQLTAIIGIAACLALIWLILSIYFRFTARGAMVAAVRSIEAGGSPTFRAAWREGQTYWARLLGLGLLVNIPLVIIAIILIGVAIAPIIAFIVPVASQVGGVPSEQGSQVALAIIAGVTLFCCALLCLVVILVIVKPVYEFAVRAIVLENSGVVDSLSVAWDRVRANLGSVIILYLILLVLGFAWGLVLFVVFLPVGIFLAAVLAFASAQSTGLVILLAIIIGIPAAVVMALVSGIFESFVQTVWTEAYMAALRPGVPGPTIATTPTNPPPGPLGEPAA